MEAVYFLNMFLAGYKDGFKQLTWVDYWPAGSEDKAQSVRISPADADEELVLNLRI